jgi:large subunit ribosomal protein L29
MKAKATKVKDTAQLSLKEIENQVRELKEKLVLMRVRKQTGQVEKPSQLRTLRRDIARLLTFARQKQEAK